MLRILLIGVLLAAARCNRPAATEGRLHAIEANLNSLRPVNGTVNSAEGKQVPFTAYFQQMDLQMVEEEPEGSPIRKRFYFHKGDLFYYRLLSASHLERQFVIDKNGKMQNAIPTPFPKDEYSQLASRAVELKAAAISRAGRMFVFPLMRTPD